MEEGLLDLRLEIGSRGYKVIIKETVKIGDQVITLETGRIAKQAHGAVVVSCGETVVLVTACGTQEPRPGIDFLPLSVDYVEKTYAAGKIPGGFFKREGRLRDAEVLTSRLIDRPCRPLFPEGYRNDVQIIATVLSADKKVPSDMLALLGASAALHISNIPWSGPIGGVRVGRVNGTFVANPTYGQMADSDLDLIVAASKDAIVMVEGECHEVSESDLLEALFFAHAAVQPFIQLVEKIRQAVGKEKWTFEPAAPPQELVHGIDSYAAQKVKATCDVSEKHERYSAFKQIKKETLAALETEIGDNVAFAKEAYEDLCYRTMRAQILEEGRRVDGRDTTTVRPISIEVGLLPRTHGSALFTRGETQAIVTATLGTAQDEQRVEGLVEEGTKRFLLHYNFPPFSVGEVKMLRGAGRREIGHGNLAERALTHMLPTKEEFPYTIRIVSEITESNGSSSMATVCGGALAMLDAGIPLHKPVAGVAMGLIKTGDKYAILTDILGDEDHLGDMDFKVCGTTEGVTAIQMDIKISGLTREILKAALEQAREARLHVLSKMTEILSAPRAQLSQYAPRISTIKVKPDQVRLVIGPGGKTIKGIIEQTGVSINVEDDGTVNVASSDPEASQKAIEIIRGLTVEPEVGQVYKGVVRRVEAYGAFVELTPSHDGMVHISDMDWSRIEKVEDVMNLGDEVEVKVTNVDRDGRIRLSRKDLFPKPEGYVEPPERPRSGGGGGGRPSGGGRGPRRDGGGGRNGERGNDRFRR
ncbi:MAG: polyribonucleotide nucleotidyltransferase [Myxococcales bacterium]|nr:polyribonucleotide nucleotidyltransferase [Myxococcales bacterium]